MTRSTRSSIMVICSAEASATSENTACNLQNRNPINESNGNLPVWSWHSHVLHVLLLKRSRTSGQQVWNENVKERCFKYLAVSYRALDLAERKYTAARWATMVSVWTSRVCGHSSVRLQLKVDRTATLFSECSPSLSLSLSLSFPLGLARSSSLSSS